MRPATFFIASFALFVCSLPAAAPQQEIDLKQMLRVGHPRLLVLDEDVARLKETIKADPTAGEYFDQVRDTGDRLLNQPVFQRELIGPRLLHVSRGVLVRVLTLGGLYRLTGEMKYADRARDEMLAAARFQDWNPSHFLDVAEMTAALGIGYDWLFGALSGDERAEIKAAIVEKGLKPGLEVYAKPTGWHLRTNNWNQVCNGGLTVGALAIADEEPQIAGKILAEAKKSLPRAMAEFSDGGCIEGPGYWGYATMYIAFYASAMQTALGDTTILNSPGVNETGMFRIQSISPIARTFNFADGGESAGGAAQMFYFARVFDAPVYAAHERIGIGRAGSAAATATAMHLLWFNGEGTKEEFKALPRAALFDRINAAFFRSAWADPQAAFVGFKGGENSASHANLDLGTFVYDVDGVRWATELGPDDYNLPGYFGKQRWTYYRMRTEGQNTLTLDGENQNLKARAKIVAFDADNGSATVDLSDAYKGQAERVTRNIVLSDKQLTITDELKASKAVEVIWHMHTASKIETKDGGARALLSSGGKQLMAQIAQPRGARFEVAPADPVPAAQPNPPMRKTERLSEKLIVRLPEKVTALKLQVVLGPAPTFTDRPSLNLQPTTRPARAQ